MRTRGEARDIGLLLLAEHSAGFYPPAEKRFLHVGTFGDALIEASELHQRVEAHEFALSWRGPTIGAAGGCQYVVPGVFLIM